MDEIITLGIDIIGKYGFPIFVSLWFMFRMEKIVKGTKETIAGNTIAIVALSEKINKLR